MQRSILWPPVIRGGRCAMTPATTATTDRGRALRQVISLRVQDGTSSNPWPPAPDLGTRDATFTANTVAAQALSEATIRGHFDALEAARRARLVAIRTTADGAQRLVVIEYEDLETGDRQELEVAA
jgi:hypothetical protein